MNPALIAVELLVTVALAVVAVLTIDDSRVRDGELLARANAGRGSRGPRVRGWLNERIRRTPRGAALDQRLRGAGLSVTPLDFVLSVALGELLVVVLLYRLFGRLGSLVLVVALTVLANRWIETRRQKRMEAFVAQLPEVARVMSNGASAGLAIRASIALAGRELEDPAGVELQTVSEQLELGTSLSSALDDLQNRLPSRELAVLVQTLVIQSRSGGALVSALVQIATTLDARKELRREVRTATVGATFSGYVVVAIGLAAVVVMNLFTPGALDQLAGTFIGRVVICVAAVFFGLGFFLIRRISRIEV